MSLARTTLSGALTSTAKTVRVASATGISAGRVMKVDSEDMLVQAVNPDVSTEFTVMRGYGGTTAVAHNTGAPVTCGANSDWLTPLPPQSDGVPVFSYAAAGAITPAAGQHQLSTGAASAFTLANPSLGADGMQLTIIAGSAHAYTVTAASAFTGAGAGTVATFGGAVGDNFEVEARNGLWVIIAKSNVTVA